MNQKCLGLKFSGLFISILMSAMIGLPSDSYCDGSGEKQKEKSKLSFYEQASRNVVQIQEHASVCVEGLKWAKEEDRIIGSAFFVQRLSENNKQVFLVTARHVVDKKHDLFLATPHPLDTKIKYYLKLPRNYWVFHPGPNPPHLFPIDVAVMKVVGHKAIIAFNYCVGDCPEDQDKKKPAENHLKDSPEVANRAIFFGFPTIPVPVGSLEPFARSGIVSFKGFNPKLPISGKIPADKSLYYLDAISFGGNSGGPVMQEPLPLMGQVKLWGLITGGNMGGHDFALVTSVERIKETIEESIKVNSIVNKKWSETPPSLPIKCESDSRVK